MSRRGSRKGTAAKAAEPLAPGWYPRDDDPREGLHWWTGEGWGGVWQPQLGGPEGWG